MTRTKSGRFFAWGDRIAILAVLSTFAAAVAYGTATSSEGPAMCGEPTDESPADLLPTGPLDFGPICGGGRPAPAAAPCTDEEEEQETGDDDAPAPGPRCLDPYDTDGSSSDSIPGNQSGGGDDFTVHPLHFSGGVAERPIDLYVPSRGVSWKHVRYYNQLVAASGTAATSDVATVQGYCWSHSYDAKLTGTSTNVVYTRDMARSYDYAMTGISDGVFQWETNKRIHSRLSHNHPGDPSNTYRLQKPNGTVWIFRDFTSNWSAELRGTLWKIVGYYDASTLEITRHTSGTDVGLIDYITDPAGRYFRYSYSTIDSRRFLTSIAIWEDSSTSTASKQIAAITYTYADGTQSYATSGDLILVTVSTRATGDTGSTLSISRSTHYRYYVAGSGYDATTNPGIPHQLKYIVRPDDVARYGAGITSASSVTDYVSNEFKYYGGTDFKKARVKEEIANRGVSCCGGGGAVGTYSYDYVENTGTLTRNTWALQMKETRPDGSRYYVERNSYGEIVLRAHFLEDGDNDKLRMATQFFRDSHSSHATGQIDRVVTSGAVATYNPSTHALTYNQSGSVMVYYYDTAANLYRHTKSKRYKYIDVGTNGAPSSSIGEMVELREYASQGAWDTRKTMWPTAIYTYPQVTHDAAASSRIKSIEYAFVWWKDGSNNDTDRVKVVKATYPGVSTAENGSGTAFDAYWFYDEKGQLRWTKDAEGRVNYYAYDMASGQIALAVQDVYTGTSDGDIRPTSITTPAAGVDDWTGAAPKDTGTTPPYDFQSTSGSSSDYAQLETKREFDSRGRVRGVTLPDGQVSYVAYKSNETRVYPSWDSTAGEPRLPMQRVLKTFEDGNTPPDDLKTVLVEVANGANVTNFTTKPDGTETWPARADFVAMSERVFNTSGQLTASRVWHDIPSSGRGSSGSNYYETTYKYTTLDANPSTEGRGRAVEIRNPEGGWTKVVTDIFGNQFEVYKTATESSGSATDYKLVSRNLYGALGGSAPNEYSLGGALSQTRTYYAVSGSATNTSLYEAIHFIYDDAGRLKVAKHYSASSKAAPHLVIDYDGKGRQIASATFSADSPALDATTVAATTTTNRVTLSKTHYDKMGRVYRTEDFSIGSGGSIEQVDGRDKKLVTDYFYNRVGQLAMVDGPNSGPMIYKYDGAHRLAEAWNCSSRETTAASIYASGAFDYANVDIKIVEKTVLTLNPLGNAKMIAHHELNHNDIDGMSTGLTDNVATYTLNFFDAAGRLSASAFYGTNNSKWEGAAGPTYPSTVPTRSDDILVSSYSYDSVTGRIKSVFDPKNIESEYQYDDLGRLLQVIENKGVGGDDLNRTTAYTYDGLGNVKTISALSVDDYQQGAAGPDPQITEYVRNDSIDRNWVRQIRYPKPDTGLAATGSDAADIVQLDYHLDGQLKQRTDQNGNVVEYDYDAWRRLQHVRLTTTGSGVDDVIRRIGYTYADTGLLSKVSSYDTNTVGTGDIKNEVEFTYDGFLNLKKDIQAHGGATGGSTPYVEYGYAHATSSDETSSLNYFNRLQTIRYPNGRVVWYDASHSDTSIASINNLLSRSAQIADDNSGAKGRVFTQYDYTGGGRMVQRDHVNLGTGSGGKFGNKTALRHIRQGSSGTLYPDFDRFGRLTNLRHVNYNGSGKIVSDENLAQPVHFQYGYDRNSNRLYADAMHNQARSHAYTYDKLNRLVTDRLGTLNSTQTGLTSEWSEPLKENWTLDVLGNWKAFDRNVNGTAASETRAHNATNEITSRTVASQKTRFWVDDNFADNDTVDWVVGDINTSGADGDWSASGGTLASTGLVTPTGPTNPGIPDHGLGTVLLIEKGTYQNIRINATATINTANRNVGIVYGYVDGQNFWVRVFSDSSNTARVYQVIAGAWTQRASTGVAIAAGTPISMDAQIRSGGTDGYAAEIPLGKIGLWSSDASATFDDFKVQDDVGTYEVDGRWFSSLGDTKVDSGELKVDSTIATQAAVVRRGSMVDKYVMTFRFKGATGTRIGALVRWLGPSDWLAIQLFQSDGKARLSQRKADGNIVHLATSTTTATIANGTWYDGKVVVAPDPNDTANQRLKFYVNGSLILNTTAIDDDWDSGYVGLFRGSVTNTANFDDFKVGFDNNADGDADDTSDDVQINDDFASAAITLVSDANGNLTDDGVFKYKYDWLNRLVQVTRREDAFTIVALYAYDGLNRRIRKDVTNTGIAIVPGSDAGGVTGISCGDRVERYYYAGWRVVEETDNATTPRTLAQTVWGTEYIDEPVCRDRNTDVATGGSPDSDCLDSGGSLRYFYHQDANFRVCSLTSESGAIVERYEYDAYGEPRVFGGVAASGAEGFAPLHFSAAGNPYLHQGLRRDDESGLHENRYRSLHARLGRFMQRDPLGYVDGMNSYEYVRSSPLMYLDASGLTSLAPPSAIGVIAIGLAMQDERDAWIDAIGKCYFDNGVPPPSPSVVLFVTSWIIDVDALMKAYNEGPSAYFAELLKQSLFLALALDLVTVKGLHWIVMGFAKNTPFGLGLRFWNGKNWVAVLTEIVLKMKIYRSGSLWVVFGFPWPVNLAWFMPSAFPFCPTGNCLLSGLLQLLRALWPWGWWGRFLMI